MPDWNSQRIREVFTDFFSERDHEVRPSSSLIPNDPTLLMTNAGMVQFKPYFLGQEQPPWPRATTVQKCVRTIDIDIIGTTQRHLSFFEMLGNFSFGDYFKEKAIPYGYELVTEGYGLDPERLWYTVYETDDEAAEIWIDGVGVPADRVQRGGKDNFWQMGVPGPCGPCSEIFWDKGPEYGPEGGPIGGGEERFVEIWNLVFMQNIQDEPYNVIGELPSKSIDTGMGLERIATVLQGVDSVFELDTIGHVRNAGEAHTGLTYGNDDRTDVSLRILADHGRTVTFLIGDGVVPSNEGRGHVLRRVLRRAVRHAWMYQDSGLVMPKLVEATIEAMGGAYPGLRESRESILATAANEEEKFRRTLQSGHQLLDTELADSQARLSGSTAFKLHDTFGFPIELTKEIASERGVDVDLEGFETEMKAQRERARAAWKGADQVKSATAYREIADSHGLTDFSGYEEERSTGVVLSMLVDGEPAERVEEGQLVEVFLDRTPFYAERGGQVGDIGRIETESGALTVLDTQHAIPGLYGHRARVDTGAVAVGQTATAYIDSPRREAIRKSHTGTHLLHWAVRDVLGDHAAQAGSLVEAGRLRFDFSHTGKVAPQELAEIEAATNDRIIANYGVDIVYTSKEEADRMGALAFFGETYGETVRVVKVGEFSIELCGGTHARTSGQVGPLIVTSESSIGSNMRRVEALTGMASYEYLTRMRGALDSVGRMLNTKSAEEVPARLEQVLHRVEDLESQVEGIRGERRGEQAVELADAATRLGDVDLVVAAVGEMDPNALRQLALSVRERLAGPSVVVVGSTSGPKGALVGVVSKDLVGRGVSAAEIVGAGAAELGGGGSRDPELSQAGGPQGERIGEALDRSRESAEHILAGL
jgi:alanyl-tRNA synthetase